MMGHANSARYLEWISDCFPLDVYEQRRLDWLQINYVNEVKPGERVAVSCGQADHDPNQWNVYGLNTSTQARAFEAALRWAN
jgi:acyl-ACP thioesterase